MSREVYDRLRVKRLKRTLRRAEAEGVLPVVEAFLATKVGASPATLETYAAIILSLYRKVNGFKSFCWYLCSFLDAEDHSSFGESTAQASAASEFSGVEYHNALY